MAELNLVAKLKNQLKQEKIHLWNPPYTEDLNQPGQQHMQVSCGEKTDKIFHSHSHFFLCVCVRSCRSVTPHCWVSRQQKLRVLWSPSEFRQSTGEKETRDSGTWTWPPWSCCCPETPGRFGYLHLMRIDNRNSHSFIQKKFQNTDQKYFSHIYKQGFDGSIPTEAGF